MTEPRDDSGTLDRAAAALRAAPAPDLPTRLRAATLAAVTTRSAAARRARRRRNVMRLASVGCLLLAVGVGVGVLWPGNQAGAAERLRKALDNQAQLKSFKMVTKTPVANPPAGQPVATESVLFGQDAAIRIEVPGMVVVYKGSKLLVLYAELKSATILTQANGKPDASPGSLLGLPDMRKQLTGGVPVTEVPAVTIGGVQRPGFRATGVEHNGVKSDVTYWIDAAAELPIRSEHRAAGAGTDAAAVTVEYTYNEPLDPKLFNLAVPPGYTTREMVWPEGDRTTKPIRVEPPGKPGVNLGKPAVPVGEDKLPAPPVPKPPQ